MEKNLIRLMLSKIQKFLTEIQNQLLTEIDVYKRQHITLLRTVKNEELNYSLCRAISNYHGISNLDNYAKQILNTLYNYYMLENDISLVFNVRKQTPIGPRSINNLLYGATEFLSSIAPEKNISAQVTLNSPGDVIFLLDQVKDVLTNNWAVIFGILVLLRCV